jgi:hypothetical protein
MAVSTSQSPEATLQSELSAQRYTETSLTDYSPPSRFDAFVVERFTVNGEAEMIDATVMIVRNGQAPGAVMTIVELTDRVFREAGIVPTQKQFSWTFVAIVRIVFDRAYTDGGGMLRASEADDIEFLRRAEMKAKEECASLQLPGFSGERKTIQATFAAKRVPKVCALAYRLNPIDMAYEVCVVAHGLGKRFMQGADLNYEEMVGLLYAAVVAAPPANAVSVARFLVRWEGLIKGDRVVATKNAFLDAVRRVLPFDDAARQ